MFTKTRLLSWFSLATILIIGKTINASRIGYGDYISNPSSSRDADPNDIYYENAFEDPNPNFYPIAYDGFQDSRNNDDNMNEIDDLINKLKQLENERELKNSLGFLDDDDEQQSPENQDESRLSLMSLPAKKSQRYKTTSTLSNTNRGYRDEHVKFELEMVQCHTEWQPVDIYSKLELDKNKIEIHSDYTHLNEASCVPVSDGDRRHRITNPCSYFPQDKHVNLCYIRSQLSGNSCEMVKKPILVWMRKRNDFNEFGPWYTMKYKDFGTGCRCNFQLHY